MAIEFELKYRADETALENLRRDIAGGIHPGSVCPPRVF